MTDVFLSYKREDLKAVTRLVHALRAEGLDLWWDRDIRAGAPWEATIEKALAEARVVLVCWSKAAVASDNVRSEARWAREQGRLIQLFVEPCSPPLFFGEHQGVDLTGWAGDRNDERFAQLLESVRERLGMQDDAGLDLQSGPAPRPAPTPAPAREAKARRRELTILAVAAATVVVLAGFGGWIAVRQLLPGPTGERIAIVPFTTLGGGTEVQALAAGITDGLTSVLSGNGRPIVAGAQAQALAAPDSAEAVRKLGVRLVVSGSVAREADELKVQVRLDDPQHAVTLWTADMDAPVSQAETLQGQLGARIIAVLNCSSRALRPKNGLSDPEAMTLLLKACDIYEDQASTDNSQGLFALLDTSRQLVARAPGFAAGHSLLARFDAYYRPYLPPSMNDQLVKEARSEIDKALRIDPSDIDARVARYLLVPTGDFIDRDKAIMGVSFDPSWPYGDIAKGAFLTDVGREAEALAATQRAVAANPLSTDALAVEDLMLTGKIQQADQELARLSRLWPQAKTWFWGLRLVLYEAEQNWSGIEDMLGAKSGEIASLPPADQDRIRLVVQAARTRRPEALARARAVLLQSPQGAAIQLRDRVLQLAWLGYVDDALALAERLPRDALRADNPTSALFYPQARALRQDPRFMALAAHFGLLDYWRTTGTWPDFCSEPGLPYDCKAEAAKLGKAAASAG